MATFILILSIAALVLLLTGFLGVVLIASLHLLGWLVVALLVLGLVWTVFGQEGRRESRELRRATKRRKKLGYAAPIEPQREIYRPKRQGEDGPSALPEHAEIHREFATAVAAADERLQREEERQREQQRKQDLADESARARRAERLAPVLDALRALEVELRATDSIRFVFPPEGDSAVVVTLSPAERAAWPVTSFVASFVPDSVKYSMVPDCLVISVEDDEAAQFVLQQKRDHIWKRYTFPDDKVALAAVVNALAEHVAREQTGLGDK